MLIFFDHFYFVLPDKEFDEIVALFGSMPGMSHHSVAAQHGKWEGIYLFQQRGAFPEFVRASESHRADKCGLAFSNIQETDLHKSLSVDSLIGFD